MVELPSKEDLTLLRDIDDFVEKVNSAITLFTKRGRHPIQAAWLLQQCANALNDGKKLPSMLACVVTRADDKSDDCRDELAQRLHAADVLCTPDRERLRKALSSWRLKGSEGSRAWGYGDEGLDEQLLELCKTYDALRRLGMIEDVPEPSVTTTDASVTT
jgi:hypothetical protein